MTDLNSTVLFLNFLLNSSFDEEMYQTLKTVFDQICKTARSLSKIPPCFQLFSLFVLVNVVKRSLSCLI